MFLGLCVIYVPGPYHSARHPLDSASEQPSKGTWPAQEFISKGELNELEEQGLLQAFEYTHELAWNTLKDFLQSRGNQAIYGSRDATREAFYWACWRTVKPGWI